MKTKRGVPPQAKKQKTDNSHVHEEHNLRIFKSHSNVANYWSGIVFIFNFWTILVTLFWVSLHDLPTGLGAMIHIVIECSLFIEVMARLLLKIFLPDVYHSLNLLHMDKSDTLKAYLILFVGSFPLFTVFTAYKDPSRHIVLFARCLLMKLLRSYEIKRTVSKVEGILFYKKFKALVFVKFIKNLMIIVFVVHFFTCLWMFVQTNLTNHAVLENNNPHNPFETDESYFERNGETSAPLIDKYMDSCLWAVSTITACSFGDVDPRTLEEVLLSLITLLAGVIITAMIFSDFANLMYLLDVERAQARDQLQHALKLCEIYGVPFRTRYKIQAFYSSDTHAFSQTQYLPAIEEMPESLHTDIVLSLNKDMISRVNIFNFASPDLLISIARHFYPKVSMAGDYVVRVGDIASEMFFIKQGEVEVIATDHKTKIAVLREGAYFGEIGLLLTNQRSVSVRALTVCVFEVLSKKDFDKLMDQHPDQKKLLLQVANQRIKICSPTDINPEKHQQLNNDLHLEMMEVGEKLFSPDPTTVFSPPGHPSSSNQSVWKILWAKASEKFRDYASMDKDLDFRHLSKLVLLPTSKFYVFWAGVLTFSIFCNLMIVPYEISFGKSHNTYPVYWRVADIMVVVIYVTDIWVHMNTSIKKKEFYVPNKDYIVRRYFEENFVIDLLACAPIDYILLGMNLTSSYSSWLKLLRFIKLARYVRVIQTAKEAGGGAKSSHFIFGLALFFVCLNHIAACVMHAIATHEYDNSTGLTMLKKLAETNIVDQPLIDQPPFIQYVNFIYWAFSVSSSGSYGGDISAVTSFEKIFEIITMLFFRVYFTFISAEVATIFTSAYVSFKSNLDKKTMYDKWMDHIKLPSKIVARVKRYNEHIFNKFKGLDEQKVLDELPKTTRLEIMEFLLQDLFEAVEIFPTEEVGLFTALLNDLKLIEITEGEYVYKAGETAEEVYFIIEGEVSILTENEEKQLAYLKQNDFFGEMSLLDSTAPIRKSHVLTKRNVTLAVWHLPHIKEVWKAFPIVKDNMVKVAERRRNQNEGKDMKNSVSSAEKNTDLVTKAQNNINKEDSEYIKIDNQDFEKFAKELDLSGEENMQNLSKVPVKSSSNKNIDDPTINVKFDANGSPIIQNRRLSRFANQGEADQGQGLKNAFDFSGANLKPHSHIYSAQELQAPRSSEKKSAPSSPQNTNMFEKTEQYPLALSPGVVESDGKPAEINQKEIQLLTFNEGENAHEHGHGHHQNHHTSSYSHRHHHHAPAPKTFLQKSWILAKKAFFKFEKVFKNVRPLVLNLILFFDVMFAPMNIALEIAHSGPIQYLELTFASILMLNFLFNLKDYLNQRKEFKKVFPAAIALSAIGFIPGKHKKGNQYKEGNTSTGITKVRSLARRKSQIMRTEDSYIHHQGEGHDKKHGHEHGHDHEHHEHEITLTVLFCDILFMIPFTIVFHSFHIHAASENVFLIALQLVKLLAVEHLTWIFQQEAFKKRYALNNILVIMYAYVILNHVVACLFIIMANAKEDFNYTWYAKIPAPQFDYPNNIRAELEVTKFTKYVHATYWAYMTTSHIGVGDVTAVNSDEKIFSSIVIMISTFVYAFLFGNLASLVDDLTPKFQKEFETNYRNVLEYIKNSGLDIFLSKIHKYYNYIWQDNKGINENDIMNSLPTTMRYDIFYSRYEEILKKAKFFKDPEGKFDNKVFYSFCKKYKFAVYMENDSIVTDGQEINDVFLILEGEAEVVKYDLIGKSITLMPGDHLGGIIPNVMQIQSIKATRITKVAILHAEEFAQLREAYQDWYSNLMKYDPIYQSLIKYAKSIKLRLTDKQQGKFDIEKNLKTQLSRQKSAAQGSSESVRMLKENISNQDDSEGRLGVPLYAVEHAKGIYASQKPRHLTRSRIASQHMVPGETHSNLENESIGKNQNTAAFFIPIQNEENTLMAYSNRNSAQNTRTNDLPMGDKEPLDEQIPLSKRVDGPIASIELPQKGEEQEIIILNDSLPQLAANKEKSSPAQITLSQNPMPMMSPAASDNTNFLPQKESTFKKDKYDYESIVLPEKKTEVKKKNWFQKFLNLFRKKEEKIERHMTHISRMDSQFHNAKSIAESADLHYTNPSLNNKASLAKVQSLQPAESMSQQHVPSFLMLEDKRPSNFVRGEDLDIDEEEEEGEDAEIDNEFKIKRKKRLSLRKANTLPKKGMGFAPKLAELIHEKKKMNEQLKSLKYYINPNSAWKTVYELVHTFVIIYTVFFLPVYIGFDIPLGWGFILSEVFILIELILYPIFLMRTAQYYYGILKLKSREVWHHFVNNGFIIYVIAALPFNMIFSAIDPNIPEWLEGLLRLNRVLLITKLSNQFALFSSKYPQITRTLNIIKPTFYLAFVSHFIACLFSWSLLIEPANDFAYNFNDVLGLEQAGFAIRYMISINFILSIVTTTGYPELIIYNDYERIVCVALVYIGDALFALILGWYASNSSTLPEKYTYVFDRIRKMDYVLSEDRVPPKIRRKIENYFSYIVETRNKNKSCLEFLSGLLPATTLGEMASEQAKTFQRFSLLREFKGNKILINEIIKNLKQRTFLPHDYIITRGEYGSAMYCITEGVVHMLSPNEKKVISVLKTGAFFGELSVYTTTKRLTSFVAATFCLVYSLDKEVLKKILKTFPHADFEFKLFAQQRLDHNTGPSLFKKDKLYKVYAYLQAAKNTEEVSPAQTSKLLRIFEIPRFHLKNEERTKRTARGDRSARIKEKNTQRKLTYRQQVDEKIDREDEDDDNMSMGSLIDDCVEEEEMQHRIIDTKKSSFRVHTKKRERRYSRLQLGKEKSVSKSEGLTIKWGINLQ